MRPRSNSRSSNTSGGSDLVRPVMPAQVTRPKEFRFATSARAHRDHPSDTSSGPMKVGAGMGKAPDFAKMLRSYNQKQQEAVSGKGNEYCTLAACFSCALYSR